MAAQPQTLRTGQDNNHNSPHIIMSCKSCAHLNVCAVFRAIAPLLQSWKEGTAPIEAETLGTICKDYLSASVTNALSSLEAQEQ